MRRALERVEIAGEHAARERAWRISAAAFAQREPAPHRGRRRLAPVVAIVVVGAVAAAAFSAPGRALFHAIRETVGVQGAQPALFSLPTPGTLLVHSDGGVWVVQGNGSKRRLGAYTSASWSPHGLYVAATRRNTLYALNPAGEERWSLARPRVAFPSWTGSRTDSRIAYADKSGLHVVAGDGTGDRFVAPAENGPFAWRTGSLRELAYVSASEVRLQDVQTGRVVWRANRGPAEPVLTVSWSGDGKRLLVLAAHALRVYDEHGRLVRRNDPADGTIYADAAFVPGTHRLAVIRSHGAQSDVFLFPGGPVLFHGTGALRQLAWSPDGSWLLVTWPSADQWVLLRVVPGGATKRIRAVANISAQFRSQSFPRIEGWCCAQP